MESIKWCKNKPTNVKQLIDENSYSEFFSGNRIFAQKFNKYFANISNTNGDNFSDSSAFEDYMSSAKFSTVSFEL